GKAEGKQTEGTEVQAASGDVAFANAWLMSAEADPQPSRGIERAGRLDRAPDDSGERPANLRGGDSVWQCMPQRRPREQVERSTAIGNRTTNRGKAPFRRDDPLEDR